ncbi:hypothetical protein [Microvirga vignae]|uniref:hypothetical protein n=1 Tax=Microvirga vignae TaxID=1225564 RepID=UPI00069C0E5F|nr:hypothetical protein [Microvirga vignae]
MCDALPSLATVTAYRDTPRKRTAFLRKQRLEREALPLFAEAIAARQRSVDEEMARRHVWWNERERPAQRNARAARRREARARLFALPDPLRGKVRDRWRSSGSCESIDIGTALIRARRLYF